MRDVIVPNYGVHKILGCLSHINKMMELKLEPGEFPALYEMLIFMNFSLHILKKNEFDEPAFNC